LRHDNLDLIDHGADMSHLLQDVEHVPSFVRETDRTIHGDGSVPDDELESDGIETTTKERPVNVSGEATVARCCASLLASRFGRLAGQHVFFAW
jgi:hypothetical protein